MTSNENWKHSNSIRRQKLHDLAENRSKTRGACIMLLDLVTALSGDTGSSTVKYLLLTQQDLDLDPILRQGLADTRAEAVKRTG